jgi:hypothetical protein
LFCERIAEKFSSQMHATMACIIHATESVAAHQTPVATYKIERKFLRLDCTTHTLGRLFVPTCIQNAKAASSGIGCVQA